jgi:hypothetical protein
MFADLNRRGIALALETGFLDSSDACGRGVEGFGGQRAVSVVRFIKSSGGVLRYIAMDEPAYFGSLSTQKNACRWTMQQVAANLAKNLRDAKAEFPDLIIGATEPMPVGNVPGWIDRYLEWTTA